MKHVMVDIETAGNEDNALVVSIGATEFDPFSAELGKTFSILINPLDAEAKGGKINMSTILWWMKQDQKIMLEQFGGSEGLKRALVKFSKWYKDNSFDRVWAHGTTFDIVILKNAFRSVGVAVPWKYNEVRDLRWFQDLTVDGFQENLTDLYVDKSRAHSALADAKLQANIVQLAYECLELERPEE